MRRTEATEPEAAATFRKRLEELIDLDAQAYLKVVRARKGTPKQKREALKQARAVPLEVCKLCYKGIQMTPYLIEKGNKYLISDVEVAAECLMASFNSAMINVRINQ